MTVHMVKCHSKQVDPIGQSASFHKVLMYALSSASSVD